MELTTRKSSIRGRIRIPGSKSHTIRAVYFGAFAKGESRVIDPLRSADTASAVTVVRALGAEVHDDGADLVIRGFGGKPRPARDVVDVANSGTSLNIGLGTTALAAGATRLTGDEQIQRRPIKPLVTALVNLGAKIRSERGNDLPPVVVEGPLKGGRTDLDGVSSQYLTSLLMNCPMAGAATQIEVTRLFEVPYVDMTLWWLDKQGIRYERDGYKRFRIPGNQAYKPFSAPIPADFSSATFFIVLAAITGGEVTFENLDLTDPQGDKEVLNIIRAMGAEVTEKGGLVTVRGRGLKGIEVDMNAIPDALPALSVAACFAQGETRLVNAPQARMKETDRIKAMHDELKKFGADVTELPDGLVVCERRLKPGRARGHGDHRIVMAFAVAGLAVEGGITVDTAEAMNVTFPNFPDLIRACGGEIEIQP